MTFDFNFGFGFGIDFGFGIGYRVYCHSSRNVVFVFVVKVVALIVNIFEDGQWRFVRCSRWIRRPILDPFLAPNFSILVAPNVSKCPVDLAGTWTSVWLQVGKQRNDE